MKLTKNWISPHIYLRLAVFSFAAAFTVMFSLPASARLSFLEQVQQIVTSLQTYINQSTEEFSQQWNELNSDIQAAINSTVGDLGIPDPLESGERIREIIEDREVDLVQTSSQTQGRDAQRSWNQSYTYSLSQSVLGRQGQRTQAQETEVGNDAVQTSFNLSNESQNDVVTQDILKKMAVQNVQSVIIAKSLQSETQKQTRLMAAAGINLSDISSRLDEQSRREQAQSNSSAVQILNTAAFADAFWERRP